LVPALGVARGLCGGGRTRRVSTLCRSRSDYAARKNRRPKLYRAEPVFRWGKGGNRHELHLVPDWLDCARNAGCYPQQQILCVFGRPGLHFSERYQQAPMRRIPMNIVSAVFIGFVTVGCATTIPTDIP